MTPFHSIILYLLIPIELEVKDTTDTDMSVSYLDPYLEWGG